MSSSNLMKSVFIPFSNVPGQQKRFQILWLQNQPSWFHRQFPVKFGTFIGVELLFLEDKYPHSYEDAKGNDHSSKVLWILFR
ncbi:hypothetical protein Bca4012_006679 [Brassica carinata]